MLLELALDLSTYKSVLCGVRHHSVRSAMLCQCWDTCVLLCVLLIGVESLSDRLPPPENLSLSWNPDSLSITAQWSKPVDLEAGCKVNYTVKLYYEKCPPTSNNVADRRTDKLNYTQVISNEQELCVIIQTNPMACGNKDKSEEVYKGLSPPLALVSGFHCIYYSDKKMNCSWSLVTNTSDLQLFYRKEIEDKGRLKPCILYITNGPTKTGCHLHDASLAPSDNLHFIINGTEKGLPIQNSFIIHSEMSVKPPPPKLEFKREGEYLYFKTSIPDFSPLCWKLKYKYRKCNEEKEETFDAGNNSVLCLEYNAACKYTVQVQTIYSNNCGKGESDMSDPVSYGEDSDLNWPFKVALFVTPVVVSVCLILALVLFRRFMGVIFPEIPEPSLLFKDFLNSNNDGFSKSLGGGKLYVPVKEVMARDVRLE